MKQNHKYTTPGAIWRHVAWLGVCAFVAAGCGELPECPPGTAFEDCEPSAVPTSLTPMGMGGSSAAGVGGASSSAPAGGSAGTSSTEVPPAPSGDMLAMMPTPTPVTPPAGVDTCLDDPAKTAPGGCGCGIPDDDFDADGAVDCNEGCPDNAGRAAPMGPCGCSILTDTAGCTVLRNALRNLYTFDGEGTQVVDSVGGQNGVVVDAVGTATAAALGRLQQSGRLNLDGFGSYVELPDGMISSLTSATFEVWMAWRGGGPWARVFDFGNNVGGAGTTYLFLTPLNSLTNNLRVAYSVAGPGAAETLADGAAPLPIASSVDRTFQHIAVVVDEGGGAMRLYLNGVQVGTVPFAGDLALINDVNNWLGRSNFPVDPPLFGSLVEFRIYDQALTGAQIDTSFRAGPGALN